MPTPQLPAIVLYKPLTQLRISTALDIVFMHRDTKGNYDFGFSIGWCLKSVKLQAEELVSTDANDLEGGLTLFRITGEIGLLQNSVRTVNASALHGGRLFEMHILYRDINGTVESIPGIVGSQYITSDGTGAASQNRLGPSDAILARYPLAANYYDELGVRLKQVSTRGGENLTAKFAVTGLTFGSSLWTVGTQAQFYGKFAPALNQGLNDPDAVGSAGGSSGS